MWEIQKRRRGNEKGRRKISGNWKQFCAAETICSGPLSYETGTKAISFGSLWLRLHNTDWKEVKGKGEDRIRAGYT
jgi:hypothetical protein